MTNDLESLIRRYIPLGKRTGQGFETVKCAACNDHKVRGGFKFDGEAVVYSCFNCSRKAVVRNDAKKISSKMKEILLAFGMPEDEIDRCIASNFFNQKEAIQQVSPEKKLLEFPQEKAPLPDHSVLLTSDESPWCEVGREYLKSRALKQELFPFYVSDNHTYSGRLIIPYFFRDKIIYWQARAMDDSIQPRYKNPVVPKDNIFFNMDEVYRYTDEPLFVTEGPLDAISIGHNAVALTGASLTDFRYRELRKAASRRKVIFVIDKNLPGYKLGNIVLKEEELEWYVTVFPDNIEDANDALKKLGRLWIASHLASTACRGFQGKLLLEMKCSKG